MQRKIEANLVPGIAFVAFVGHLPLLKYTISIHEKAARELGFDVTVHTFQQTALEQEVIQLIGKLNSDKNVHAIVLLQPVPKHINPITIISSIDRNKEVEGFHPLNVLETLTKGVFGSKYPMCLPAALYELFDYYDVRFSEGMELVFAVDQDFVVNPFRSLILHTASSKVIIPGCAVTIVNNESKRFVEYCKRADFLFVITENPEFIQAEWLKSGVVIVDVYSNLVREVPSKKDPNVLIPVIRGGVNQEVVLNIASAIAPCPGGLMPVLLAILFRNAFNAFTSYLSD